MSRILLIHGAWCSGATWGAVTDLLRAQGHDVAAPDMPVMAGDRPAGLGDWRDAILAALDGGPPALLVGHSLAGMAISAAAEAAPDRIARLAYLCAFLPRDGDSALDLLKRQPETIRSAVRRGALPGTTELDLALALPIVAQDAPESAAPALGPTLRPQANPVQTDAVRLGPDRFGRVPRAYLLCGRDRTILPDLQRAMIAASPCDPVLALDTGHFPQLTAPDLLAATLGRLA